MDIQALKKKCAECGQNYEVCLSTKCIVYYRLNTPCEFCGNIGGVRKFIRFTSRGFVTNLICLKCLEKLT